MLVSQYPVSNWIFLAIVTMVIALWKFYFVKNKTPTDQLTIGLSFIIFFISIACAIHFYSIGTKSSVTNSSSGTSSGLLR